MMSPDNQQSLKLVLTKVGQPDPGGNTIKIWSKPSIQNKINIFINSDHNSAPLKTIHEFSQINSKRGVRKLEINCWINACDSPRQKNIYFTFTFIFEGLRELRNICKIIILYSIYISYIFIIYIQHCTTLRCAIFAHRLSLCRRQQVWVELLQKPWGSVGGLLPGYLSGPYICLIFALFLK